MASDEDNDSGYYFLHHDVWYRSVGKFIALFVLVVIVILIYFYAWRSYRRHTREAAHPSINGVSTPSQVVHSHNPHPPVIASLPTFVYKPAHHLQSSTDTVECAVCLNNLEEGDMARLIPTCKHIFHLQCINMWLSSHSTCPVCRSAAQPTSTARHHEMSIWVPSMGSQFDSFSPATTASLESTSNDASIGVPRQSNIIQIPTSDVNIARYEVL
ncbi:RING-H2 finger protein ATL2-like [Macadamia integrifolia]|uniref:RING-H2 finger protein ATL2-like n=1 Tax=Macadamia integrifolia TaxID=60698 RepID=UPI001C4F5FA1|nr:RING-H2 finger protein ATL2-like [Macadamia integrifolia]